MTEDYGSSVDEIKGKMKDAVLHDDASCHGSTKVMKRADNNKSSTDKMVEQVIEKLNAPPKEHVTVEESEEILPDGTIHLTRKVTKRSITHIERQQLLRGQQEGGSIPEEEVFEMGDMRIPASVSMETLETFEKPPFPETVVMQVDEVLPSGDVQKRKVIKNRMVHRIKTRHESFDAEKGSSIEEYEIDEVIPGTESIWYTDSANVSESESESDAEEEQPVRRTDLGRVEEVTDDGTVITKEIVETHYSKTRTIHSRSGSVDRETTDTVVTEEFITPSPSPRSASPVDPKMD